jgi:hypothetical protein
MQACSRRLAAWLRRAVRLALGTAALLSAVDAAAQTAAESTTWYEVAPGENLHVIAAKVLGNRSQWPRLWRLNPDIKDPDRLRPGQRIRVPGDAPEVEVPLPALAELRRLSQRVEEQPHPQAYWAPARQGDKLKERDGLRTHEKASAELAFDDGTRYVVSERSLLFLRAPAERPGARRARTLEVLAGQADLEVKPVARGTREIEVLIGGARSRTRPGASEQGQARARKADGGAAQLMVFGGAGEMSAQGVKVELPRGTGTSAVEGRPPSPAERLLPAPTPLGPAEGAAFDHANPLFSWSEVPGAASYTVEVCRDAACGELVERATRIPGARWTVDGLPVGTFHWRVMAVSASGLDGYSSPAVPFSVRSPWRRPRLP